MIMDEKSTVFILCNGRNYMYSLGSPNHVQTIRLSLQFSKGKSLFLTNPGTTRPQILKVSRPAKSFTS
jgi:hypothetical protein